MAAYDLANRLLALHGLDGWGVELDGAKRRAGVCRHHERLIGLSAPLTRLHDEDEVRDTILHEIAHALVGPEHQHDDVWRQTALRIGGTGARCVPGDAPRVAGAWLGVCHAGHTRERHKRPDRVMTCGQCSTEFDLTHVFEWTYHGRPATMHPNYVAEFQGLREGVVRTRVPVGTKVRVTASGQFHGRVGTVVKLGRTSYHLQLPEGTLRVLFSDSPRADA